MIQKSISFIFSAMLLLASQSAFGVVLAGSNTTPSPTPKPTYVDPCANAGKGKSHQACVTCIQSARSALSKTIHGIQIQQLKDFTNSNKTVDQARLTKDNTVGTCIDNSADSKTLNSCITAARQAFDVVADAEYTKRKTEDATNDATIAADRATEKQAEVACNVPTTPPAK